MVLSNKKLKQKLRAQLAESLAKSESQLNQPDLNDSQTRQSFKSLFNSATQKPKLSKREKRRVTIPSIQDHKNGVEDTEIEEGSDGLKKNKKRKREKDGVEVKDVDEEQNEAKDLTEKKTSQKKKKKNKRKKGVKKEEEIVQKADGESEEQAVAESIQTHTSKEDTSISTKVYVGGIPYYSTVDDIQSFFEGCGSITEIDCLKFPETGKFNGIAMISFRTEAAAKRALALDGSDMGGLSLKVQPYKATRDKKVSDFAPAMMEGYNRIYVGNLSWDMTDDELKKFFSDCNISSVRLGKDKETGEFRGFAHVDFADSLSLTMALKLDQKPLFGRPVRIRCAVPPKSANPSLKSNLIVKNAGETGDKIIDDAGRKAKRHTCYKCGEPGHLSLSCPNRKADFVALTYHKANDVVFDKTDAFDKEEADYVGDGKLKRRTCYDCGEKGHLSSSCPNRKAADVANSGKDNFASVVVDDYVGIGNNTINAVSDGKLRRRACYECGEKGHLSSACPQKQAIDVEHLRKESNEMEVETAEDVKNMVAIGKKAGDNVVGSVSDGKLRRRTCYECGERGHLSSACPKKQAAEMEHSRKEVETAEEVKTMVAVGKEAGDNVVSSISEGKLRRRTCYECGERGHLSSACPKKEAADVVSSSKEANAMELGKAEEVKTTSDVGKEDGNNVVSSVSGGKLRRRTCYECGLKGHLSSLCPSKIEADLTNPNST